LKRVRELGRYYEKVLTTQTARVLVDASNVARHDAAHKGRLEYLLAMREELRRGEFFPIIFVADASLPHFIDAPKALRGMIVRGEVLVTASGQQADEILARQARETGAYVVTNDRNFHFASAPDFTPSRLSFRIEDGVVLLG
jgi:predicted nucleic acid-binding protein